MKRLEMYLQSQRWGGKANFWREKQILFAEGSGQHTKFKCYSSKEKCFPTALKLCRERYLDSQEPKNTTKSHSTTNLTQIFWKCHKGLAASALGRRSRLSGRRDYIGLGGWGSVGFLVLGLGGLGN